MLTSELNLLITDLQVVYILEIPGYVFRSSHIVLDRLTARDLMDMNYSSNSENVRVSNCVDIS